MNTWDDRQPIYQQLADLLAARLLDGDPPEGQAMPSVRVLAHRHLLNPLTVNRALQALAEAGLLESRRGLGLFVTAGARDRRIVGDARGVEILRVHARTCERRRGRVLPQRCNHPASFAAIARDASWRSSNGTTLSLKIW